MHHYLHSNQSLDWHIRAAIGRPVSVSQSSDIVTATQAGMDAARESLLTTQRIPRGLIGFAIIFIIIFSSCKICGALL